MTLRPWAMIAVVNWDEFQRAVDELAGQINFEPTLLVAVARGGWIPTRFLSDALGVKHIASIGMTYEDADRSNPVTYSLPSPLQSSERVLLIEDFLESGKSMRDAAAVLQEQVDSVKTASLWFSNDSVIAPDYSLGRLDETPMFPWER